MLTREEILARKAGQETYKLSDDSGEVIIHGISRDDALRVGELRTEASLSDADNYLISRGLAEPTLAPVDVAEWAKVPGQAGVLSDLSEAIAELSGMTQGAGKSRVPRTRKRS